MEEIESELDRLNKYYRNKIVTLIPTRTAIEYVPENIPSFCTGMFLEAMESGIWLLSLRTNKRDFFYHDKIVKIEEVDLIDINCLPEKTREEVTLELKSYDERKKKEKLELQKQIQEIEDLKDKSNDIPDVIDPMNISGINEMLERAKKMIDENNFLEKRS